MTTQRSLASGVVLLSLLSAGLSAQSSTQPAPRRAAAVAATQVNPAEPRALIDRYCVGCHNGRVQNGKMRLDNADITTVGAHGEIWERVVRKVRGGVMPPPGAPRPEPAAYDRFATFLERELDRAAVARPDPGRTESLHRLNRTEYRNIVRDLFALDMDFSDLLAIDDSGGGEASFDNIATSLRLTQTLMEQYLSVGLKVARLAVGAAPPESELRFKMSDEIRQDMYLDGMPFGTRGGLRIDHIFPVDGEYEFRVAVAGQGDGDLELALDGERLKLFEYGARRRGPALSTSDEAMQPLQKFAYRATVTAGAKAVTAAFLKQSPSLKMEYDRTPLEGGRTGGRLRGTIGGMGTDLPGIDEVIIAGPLKVTGPGNSPSRQRVFTCKPATTAAEEPCARTILSNLARRAYRRPLTDHDVTVLLGQYKEGRAEGPFDAGIERGIRAMLVNPNFLLRLSAEPSTPPANGVYRISDLELASRVSFFIWSSVPDDRLLNAAVRGELRKPLVLEREVKRMLADPRAESLTRSFAAQWLWVRNLKAAMPSEPIYPNFDEALRQAFQTEIEMFFASVVRENRSVVDLIDTDYTFVNDRLARHYGIPSVFGTDFRRITLAADSPRRGLLGKGLLLLVTSRSTRTSPVVRGRWILENLLGTPPPAPPANVPPLPEQKQADGRVLTVRELMASHRANPVCASCHATIDPAGFALEQFDGVGKWRLVDQGFQPIDASGKLPDGTKFSNVHEFRSLLLSQKEQFVRTMTNKLLMYALGRGTEYYDAAATRKVVRDAASSNYRFSALVLGIVKSTPFQMRKAAAPASATQSAALR